MLKIVVLFMKSIEFNWVKLKYCLICYGFWWYKFFKMSQCFVLYFDLKLWENI